MWSVSATRLPGPASGRSEPAALVSTRISAPSSRSVRIGVVTALASIPSYTCERPRRHATGTPSRLPERERARVAGDGADAEAGQLGVRDRDRVGELVGERAEPGAEHEPEARA